MTYCAVKTKGKLLYFYSRLDLEDFSLRGPHKYLGSCRQDRLIISTTLPNGIGISELCGNNSGQHRMQFIFNNLE